MVEGVVLVTGGHSGIGFECARELARRGSRVVIASRDQAASAQAVRRIAHESGDGAISALALDLGSLGRVAYVNSKLCNLWFSYELARRLEARPANRRCWAADGRIFRASPSVLEREDRRSGGRGWLTPNRRSARCRMRCATSCAPRGIATWTCSRRCGRVCTATAAA
jgi:hypothetical protein